MVGHFAVLDFLVKNDCVLSNDEISSVDILTNIIQNENPMAAFRRFKQASEGGIRAGIEQVGKMYQVSLQCKDNPRVLIDEVLADYRNPKNEMSVVVVAENPILRGK